MKKIILAVTILALAGSQVQTAKAHGGFGIAAGVVGGLTAGAIIGESIAHPYYAAPAYYPPAPVYYGAPAPAYCPPVAYAPAPAYYPYCAPAPVVTVYGGFGYRSHYYYPRYGYGYRGHYRGRW